MRSGQLITSVAHAEGSLPGSLEWHFRRFIGDCELEGARVLDVGCGTGSTSFLAALLGAEEVIALEPEAAGCTAGASGTFIRIREATGLSQCRLLPVDLMQYASSDRFDVIMLRNSINHIREIETDIRRDARARRLQLDVAAHLLELLKPGGAIILSDCSRRNLFGDIGARSPFAPTIEWPKHQTPGAWRGLFEELGVRQFAVRWIGTYRLRWLSPFLENPVGAYLTNSYFALRMRTSAQ